jgi:hypothetical protein
MFIAKELKTIDDDIQGAVFKILPTCRFEKQVKMKKFIEKFQKKTVSNLIINHSTSKKIDRLNQAMTYEIQNNV